MSSCQEQCIGREPEKGQELMSENSRNSPCCYSVTKSCLTLCDPMDCSTAGFTVLHHLWNLCKLISIELVIPSNHLILCQPFLLPSVFPSTGVFSNEFALYIRWPKYWSFSISLFNEYSGLISFRIDWIDLLAGTGTTSKLSR